MHFESTDAGVEKKIRTAVSVVKLSVAFFLSDGQDAYMHSPRVCGLLAGRPITSRGDENYATVSSPQSLEKIYFLIQRRVL